MPTRSGSNRSGVGVDATNWTGPRHLELDYLRTDFHVHCVCLLALKKIAVRQSKLLGIFVYNESYVNCDSVTCPCDSLPCWNEEPPLPYYVK